MLVLRGAPPAQGVIQILGKSNVSVIMPDKFPQSPINSGWCLSSAHRQSGGYCRYAAETGRRHPCHAQLQIPLDRLPL